MAGPADFKSGGGKHGGAIWLPGQILNGR